MMPAYNFRKNFVPMILDLSKPHTIRRRRAKRPTVPGDMLSLYTGMRTKQCTLIATAPCVAVEPCVIKPALQEFWIWEDETPGSRFYDNSDPENPVGSFRLMTRGEVQSLSIKDGFVMPQNFFDFFKLYKREVLDDFEVIYWDTSKLIDFWEVRNG
jgi:hypothetical protein